MELGWNLGTNSILKSLMNKNVHRDREAYFYTDQD